MPLIPENSNLPSEQMTAKAVAHCWHWQHSAQEHVVRYCMVCGIDGDSEGTAPFCPGIWIVPRNPQGATNPVVQPKES